MKENTNKKVTKKSAIKTEKNVKVSVDGAKVVALENNDMKNAILTTSLLVNLFFLTAWVAIQVSTDYAQTIGAAIFNL